MVTNDDGTNPVIGFIILVGIVLILASVIALFVVGLSENFQKIDNLQKFNKTITIQALQNTRSNSGPLEYGIIDTEGNGYLLEHSTDAYVLELSETYYISYYINPKDKTRVVVSIENTNPKPSAYICRIGSDGVCK